MHNVDIEALRTILRIRDRADLADLMRYSYCKIEFESTEWGKGCRVKIFAPPLLYESLQQLPQKEREYLIEVATEAFMLSDYSLVTIGLDFVIDTKIKIIDSIICPKLDKIDFTFIKEQLRKCEEKIVKGDYDGAVTNARTLIETICKLILDTKNVSYEDSGDLINLYKEAYRVLGLDPKLYQDEGLKQFLSGIISIINGIARIRNKFSDAHAKSENDYFKLSDYHAIFVVNVSRSLAEFLYNCLGK